MKRPIPDVPGRLCGCCEGLAKWTPSTIVNRPGLNALAYRAGTHATFLETMIARLTDHTLEIESGQVDEHGQPQKTRIRPPLRGLTTRDTADPAIALLDAWATVADVLTFYQERVANEGYLRTATERRSILELARLVGYTLRPGVAASAYLAFTLEEDAEVEIPAGTRAQSLPGPGQLPQSFETFQPLPARAEWNELKPRMTRPQQIPNSTGSTDTLHFTGVTTNLKPNDPLLFVFGTGANEQVLCRVQAVQPQPAENRTKVTLQQTLETQALAAFATDAGRVLDHTIASAPSGVTAKEIAATLTEIRTEVERDVAGVALLLRDEAMARWVGERPGEEPGHRVDRRPA
jgi:hypothetical protein